MRMGMSKVETEIPVKINFQVDSKPDLESKSSNTDKDVDKKGLQYSKAGILLKWERD